MGKVYKNTYGQDLRVKVGKDLSTAVSHMLLVKKPNGVETTWLTSIATPPTNGVLSHIITEGELNVLGLYKIQAYVQYASGIFKGETVALRVYDKFQ